MKTLLQTILSLLILTVSIDSYASCESVSHGDRVRDIDNLRVIHYLDKKGFQFNMLLASGSIITIESKMGDGYYSEASASRVLAAIMWAKSSGERIFFNWKKCTVNGKDTYTLTQFSILR